MSVPTGRTVGAALCAALGIDADNVIAINLQCDPRGPARLDVQCMLRAEGVDDLIAHVKRYRLVEVES